MRPLLLGLDPGEGEGALPASSRSGGRLARLAGLNDVQYEARFDRRNLHPEPMPQSADADAARGMASDLRGRRVIALGNRAMMALGAHPFSWRLSPAFDCVVSGMPHPSGLNRFWNEPPNVAKAEAFIRAARKPCVHVEGPDGSGKSTLVPQLAARLALEVVPTEGPPRSGDECVRRVNLRVAPGTVCDRSSGLISELVYGPVLRGGTFLREDLLWDLVASLAGSVIFVYCCPPKLNPTVREGEDPAHVQACNDREAALRDRYDAVMMTVRDIGCKVLAYDWTKQWPGGLAAEISQCAA